MHQRLKTVDAIARSGRQGEAFEWYGRRFRVPHGDEAQAVPVTSFTVGGTPRVVWRADLDGSLERLIDRLDRTDDESSEPLPPRGRLS